jgi:hypothetical protein
MRVDESIYLAARLVVDLVDIGLLLPGSEYVH